MSKASLLVVVVVAMLCADQAYAQGWQALLPGLISQLTSLWSRGKLQFLDSECSYRQRPTIYRWQLYYKANFVCPGIGNIRGYCKTRSRSKAINCAIEDFLKQAISAGIVTEEKAATWLGQQGG
ncbi:Anti-lipopolysaccharide factor/Scygonadin [Trinorchestia longiramus]|nr:Anti-lipopolysaccharide factor/Scygonadin [Trinorchestia longiramus]